MTRPPLPYAGSTSPVRAAKTEVAATATTVSVPRSTARGVTAAFYPIRGLPSRAMTRAATIGELITLMEDTQARLDAAGDERRHWHGVYRRGTVAVRDEIARGGFHDTDWLERW